MNKLYEIFGGDHGNYKICEAGNATVLAFVRRNQTGGGYTVSRADESKSVSMRHMPTAGNGRDQASSIMALLDAESTVDTLEMYLRVSAALDTTKKNDMAYLLSRLSDDLATQYFTDTGTKVGSALGWDTGIDHSTVKSEGKS